ncbi:MAG: DUF86 domain-containing protein [Crocosphaera sp.]|nr:DUF86 domain-containing protein [Crocosphaera sp.]
MTKRELTEYLNDILMAINQIQKLTEQKKIESFKNNSVNFSAIIQSLVIIGEAVKNVPNDVRDSYPHVPWKAIAGMRDKLVHEYWAIDEQVVWKVISKNIPQLKTDIFQIIKDISRE